MGLRFCLQAVVGSFQPDFSDFSADTLLSKV